MFERRVTLARIPFVECVFRIIPQRSRSRPKLLVTSFLQLPNLMARLLGRAHSCFPRIAFILYFSFALQAQGYAISYTCDSVGADDVWMVPDVKAAMAEAKETIGLGIDHILEAVPLDNTRDKLFPGELSSRRQVQGE
jgi:hypothetical protein